MERRKRCPDFGLPRVSEVLPCAESAVPYAEFRVPPDHSGLPYGCVCRRLSKFNANELSHTFRCDAWRRVLIIIRMSFVVFMHSCVELVSSFLPRKRTLVFPMTSSKPD